MVCGRGLGRSHHRPGRSPARRHHSTRAGGTWVAPGQAGSSGPGWLWCLGRSLCQAAAAHSGGSLQSGDEVTSHPLLFVPPTATAVRVLGRRRDPPGPAPLRRVRGSLCRLLPGPGPLLCLGRQRLHPLLHLLQEVRRGRERRGGAGSGGEGPPGPRLPCSPPASPQAEPAAGRPARQPHPPVPRLQLQW